MLRLHGVRRVVLSVAAATVFVAVSGVGVAHAGPGQFDVVGPSGSGTFGQQVVVLANGNVVVTDPGFDLDVSHTDVGAVYLYDGVTHQVISTLTGSTTDDNVGGGFNGVVALSNGNYVVCSPLWDLDGSHTDVGAITLGNGLTGSTGPVTALNSVLGTTSGGGGWGLVYGFDYVHYQLVVGRPGDNTVTWMTVPVLPPTGANTNAFVAAALVFLAVGTVLVATRRRGPRAI